MGSFRSAWNRFYAMFKARNLEFFRDRGSLAWSILFPIVILAGIAFAFDGDGQTQFKIGVMDSVPEQAQAEGVSNNDAKTNFYGLKYLEFVVYNDLQNAQEKVQKHAIDILIDHQSKQYWINQSSPQGYFVEQLLLGHDDNYQRVTLDGKEVRYIDWLLPGILGMNMMFSSLLGVSHSIVRYRKNSVLKRLKATPLRAIEFVFAQIMSRLFIVLVMSAFVFVVCDLMFDFYMIGSYLDLLVIGVLGSLCMISLGLLVASRSRSEELTGGIMNVITWPMMILSGVWFSLEGAPEAVVQLSQVFPLTHVLNGARAIMTDGSSIWDLQFEVGLLLVLTVIFMTLCSWLFRWEGDGR